MKTLDIIRWLDPDFHQEITFIPFEDPVHQAPKFSNLQFDIHVCKTEGTSPVPSFDLFPLQIYSQEMTANQKFRGYSRGQVAGCSH
jgi:hypothetical protein